MFSAIATALSAILGMGALLGGPTTTGPTNPDTEANIHNALACYSPSPSEMITLTWPDNFVNLTDHRTVLNPHVFGSKPPRFSANTDCREKIFTDTNNLLPSADPIQRTYIKVRTDLRVSSCKVDELAGPYGKGQCENWGDAPSHTHRGSCTITDYQDLRKVGEVFSDGKIQEIFWVPTSHNVGCDYDPNNPNCQPNAIEQDRSNAHLNLREFIYVLKRRDAFDFNDPRKGCPARWDAGSADKGACSHFFDVYMAQDLYNKTITGVDNTDPDYKTYTFIKEIVENCREDGGFVPIVDVPGIAIPPRFIELPFVSQNFFTPRLGKITPGNADQFTVYQTYILNRDAINPSKTNLTQLRQANMTITPCAIVPSPTPPGAPPLFSCFALLGTIPLTGDNQTITFDVFIRSDSPQTFYLKDPSGRLPFAYIYSITDDILPIFTDHNPSLQLGQLRFSSENQWTWATPWCKPALYFYPEKPTQLNVKLELDGVLTESDPLYDPSNGWNILARPDGSLFHTPNTTYQIPNNYLYYEADISTVDLPKTGWVIEQSAVSNKLSSLMKITGFNEKETADFLAYWLPRLKEKPYYFIGILPEEIMNEKEKLIMNAHPDTLIRARFVFEGLDQPISVNEPVDIPSYRRTGFVVADWGGTIVGTSCTDITVQ